MTGTTIALVTGANKGIGLATAKRFTQLGWTVLLGSRDLLRGRAAAATLTGDVSVVQLDVTGDESVAAAAEEVEQRHGRLDVLVNNAAVGGGWISALDCDPETLSTTFETNVYGPVRVTKAFLPLMRRSAAPRIVMVSSGVGSLALTGDLERFASAPVALHYPASKTALNMITSVYAKALPEFRVNAADPGFTATDLNGHRGTQTVEEGCAAIVTLATLPPDGPTGGFFDKDGPVPW
ncbi:SDR family oxidoreductase [Actinomycetes bacterium KLBMP 9759]